MDKGFIGELAAKLRNFRLDRQVRIMEVCGTHTTEFFRTGVRNLFPDTIQLVDGPGCPVCVTANGYLDRIIEIGKVYNPVIATFGDMIKVPSSYSSLGLERSRGLDVRVVYSPLEALDLAGSDPGREVVFISVGFETTAPVEASALLEARSRGLNNFSVYSGNKLTPPAVQALLDSGEVHIDGFILPGHVSAVIGVRGWRFIPEKYGRPCVVAGFENYDLMAGTLMLAGIIARGKIGIENEYRRVVSENGNEKALEIMNRVFDTGDADWRGIGVISGSGLTLNDEFAGFDAEKKFPVSPPEPREHPGCRCGELLRGLIIPTECPLFGGRCVPGDPVGPCMVSSEGPCAAYYKYGSL